MLLLHLIMLALMAMSAQKEQELGRAQMEM